MADQPQTTPSVWRQRRYHLEFFGRDERLVITIPLTEEQAAAIGEKCLPSGSSEDDGLGEYPLDDIAFMGPG